MSLWKYMDKGVYPSETMKTTTCLFCNKPLKVNESSMYGMGRSSKKHKVSVCEFCGWWVAIKQIATVIRDGPAYSVNTYGAAAILKNIDVSNISTPIEEVRQYLTAKYNDRFNVNPKLMEETVASVFRDLGYKTCVTPYRKDNGIDIFLERNDERIGVQVKRTKNSIEAEQIRALTGALVYNKVTKGIFLTTSKFRSGAEETVQVYKNEGYSIDLYNADKLFEILSITNQVETDINIDDCLQSVVKVDMNRNWFLER